jgi:hypothetical protein
MAKQISRDQWTGILLQLFAEETGQFFSEEAFDRWINRKPVQFFIDLIDKLEN